MLLHTNSPRLTESLRVSVCLLLRTTADAGRRESTRDLLAKIIPVHEASNAWRKITQSKKKKTDYVKSRLHTFV